MKKHLLLALVFAALLAAPTTILIPALAQQQNQPGAIQPQSDGTFPASLGYAALGLALTVYGSLAEVIRRLWTRNGELAALHEAEKEKLGEKHKAEIDKFRDRVELEQKARLDDLERWRKEEQEKMQTAWTALRDSAEGFRQVSRQLDKLLEGWNGEE